MSEVIHTRLVTPPGIATSLNAEHTAHAVGAATPSGAGVALTLLHTGIRGERGTTGDPGPTGGAVLAAVADQAVGGHRVVFLDGGFPRYADASVLSHANIVFGLSLNAVSPGEAANLLRMGEVTEPSWSWAAGMPVYLGFNGVLTQTLPPSAVFSLIVGFPVAATKLFVSIREPIILF